MKKDFKCNKSTRCIVLSGLRNLYKCFVNLHIGRIQSREKIKVKEPWKLWRSKYSEKWEKGPVFYKI